MVLLLLDFFDTVWRIVCIVFWVVIAIIAVGIISLFVACYCTYVRLPKQVGKSTAKEIAKTNPDIYAKLVV